MNEKEKKGIKSADPILEAVEELGDDDLTQVAGGTGTPVKPTRLFASTPPKSDPPILL